MSPHDGSARGRLLTESSTRAFAALRSRATASLARIRAIAAAGFCTIAAAYTIAGNADLHMNFWPLLAYTAAGWTVYRWGNRGGWREKVSTFSPVADPFFVFALQWQSLSYAEDAAFGAGWTVGLYALLVGFSALSLRARVISSTAVISFLLLAILQYRAHIDAVGIAGSGIVLAMVAMAAASVVREIDRVVARLVVNEVSHDELRRAQSEAETLTHLLVHDMKGPLTGLIGMAEVVASEVPDGLKGDVKMIEEQGRRLQAMVGDLLAIARLERGVLQSAPEPVDLSALLASLADSYAAAARQAGAQIGARVESGLSATLHREMVHRMYDNLVLNALDFVRPGGRIEVAAWQDGPELRLAVRNTGEPVPPETRLRLFEKHASRGSRRQHNLGLGLYLCRLVAVAHDGIIELADEAGWAASFVARLPVEARKAAVRLTPEKLLVSPAGAH
ncbi:MAG: sensor histidine kinase [Myxococcales bacterium]